MTTERNRVPDLGDPEARAAYRRELKRLYRGWRLAGFLLILLGAGGLFYTQIEPWRHDLRLASWLLIAAGWALFIAIIIARTRYHRRRMAGE